MVFGVSGKTSFFIIFFFLYLFGIGSQRTITESFGDSIAMGVLDHLSLACFNLAVKLRSVMGGMVERVTKRSWWLLKNDKINDICFMCITVFDHHLAVKHTSSRSDY